MPKVNEKQKSLASLAKKRKHEALRFLMMGEDSNIPYNVRASLIIELKRERERAL